MTQWHQLVVYFTVVGPMLMVAAACWLVRWAVK